MASVRVARLVQTTLMKVPRVKAKDTMPIMPEIRKKGEVAVVDTTTPMTVAVYTWCSGCVACGRSHGAAIVIESVGSIVQLFMFTSCLDDSKQ